MDIEWGKFIEDFVMIILPLSITFLIIGNKLDSLEKKIKELEKLKKRYNKLENKKDNV